MFVAKNEEMVPVAKTRALEQSTVLFGQEESRSNGIHADAFTKFCSHFIGHERSEIRDSRRGFKINNLCAFPKVANHLLFHAKLRSKIRAIAKMCIRDSFTAMLC